MAATENKLDSFLSHRPEAQELVERGIMKDPKVAPALQQHMEELNKAKIQDSLRHKIDHRPTREELVDQKILEPTMGPAFQKMQDTLENKIGDRPEPEKLVEKGILSDVPNKE
ncbi:hypothetical protein BDB00DRAFT_797307 [Zychaea mexicana]|uniref:uncharacterized protein n=1 Tax=Zychaea mexicana TaxID=64656 RepID=UPI0022FF23E2|nr:uncharacterized protein BDB00DRAFT_797307 [Zychaea mexicana]KAI9498921.1 hypothetical protein BDB00DRAFT_797307 [Zychaea mexicana]